MIITLQDFEKGVEYYLERAKDGDITVMDNGKVLGYVTTQLLCDQGRIGKEEDTPIG